MNDPKSTVKLNPCPCCGGEVKATVPSFGVAGLVVCNNCNTMFLIPWDEAETAPNLVHAWNGRAKK